MNEELNLSDMNWCKRTIESLRQELAIIVEQNNALASRVSELRLGRDQLRQKLAEATDQIAAAVDACKIKDDALEQAYADIAGLHDQLEEPQITQDEYKLELEQLRQHVTLLRDEVIRCRDWFEWELMLLRDERYAADEALAATEPKT